MGPGLLQRVPYAGTHQACTPGRRRAHPGERIHLAGCEKRGVQRGKAPEFTRRGTEDPGACGVGAGITQRSVILADMARTEAPA